LFFHANHLAPTSGLRLDGNNLLWPCATVPLRRPENRGVIRLSLSKGLVVQCLEDVPTTFCCGHSVRAALQRTKIEDAHYQLRLLLRHHLDFSSSVYLSVLLSLVSLLGSTHPNIDNTSFLTVAPQQTCVRSRPWTGVLVQRRHLDSL
jgi:hypothetical protein